MKNTDRETDSIIRFEKRSKREEIVWQSLDSKSLISREKINLTWINPFHILRYLPIVTFAQNLLSSIRFFRSINVHFFQQLVRFETGILFRLVGNRYRGHDFRVFTSPTRVRRTELVSRFVRVSANIDLPCNRGQAGVYNGARVAS